MPTYQYACTDCDHRFEAVQSFSDASLTTCPQCSGALRKVYGSVGVVFKGSGFYRTDSRSGGKGGSSTPAEKSSGEKKSGESKSGESKSDSAAKSPAAEKSASKPAAASSTSGSGSGSGSAGGSSS